MNIFLVDKDPAICAQALCDLRLNKMILETAQMLCAAYYKRWPELYQEHKDVMYKVTHANHPCTVWVAADIEQYIWTVHLFKALHDERKFRTGMSHLSYTKLYDILAKQTMGWLPIKGINFTFNCSNQVPSSGNVFQDYKQCLIAKWKVDNRHPTWNKRGMPAWAVEPVVDTIMQRGSVLNEVA